MVESDRLDEGTIGGQSSVARELPGRRSGRRDGAGLRRVRGGRSAARIASDARNRRLDAGAIAGRRRRETRPVTEIGSALPEPRGWNLAIISPTNIAPDLDLAAVIGTHRDARKAPPRTLGCERRMDGILTCVGSGAKIQTRGSAAEVYGDRRGKKARKSFAASVRADFPRNIRGRYDSGRKRIYR